MATSGVKILIILNGDKTIRFAKPITALILTTALAFGIVQGQEMDETADTGVAPAATQNPQRSHQRPPHKPMSDEERAERRAKWDAMSDEEKRALREKRYAERRARWESMSEEERQAAREKRRQRRGGKDRPLSKDHPQQDHPRPDVAPDGA